MVEILSQGYCRGCFHSYIAGIGTSVTSPYDVWRINRMAIYTCDMLPELLCEILAYHGEPDACRSQRYLLLVEQCRESGDVGWIGYYQYLAEYILIILNDTYSGLEVQSRGGNSKRIFS